MKQKQYLAAATVTGAWIFLLPGAAFAAIYGSTNATGGAVGQLNTNTHSNRVIVCDEKADGHRAVYQLATSKVMETIVYRQEAVGNSNCTDTNLLTAPGTRTQYQRVCLADGANSAVFSCSGWRTVTLD